MKPSKQTLDRSFATSLEPLLARRTLLSGAAVTAPLIHALDATDAWLSELPAPTSTFNVRMFFFQRLCELFPEHSLRSDAEITDVVLADTGVCSPGDEFDRPRTGGGTDHWKILWRQVGPQFGLEFAMQNQKGEILHRESFD